MKFIKIKKFIKTLPGFRKIFRALEIAESDNKQLKNEIENLKKILSEIIFYQGSSFDQVKDNQNDFPVPPEVLRYLVAGTADLEWFIKIGFAGAEGIDEIIKKYCNRESGIRIHDFGCGCGRVSRHLLKLYPEGVSGSDCNVVAANWCERNLPNGKFFVNGFKPPLNLPTECLDVLFSYSVFTHLSLELQELWKKEFARVLKSKQGLLILSLHGRESAKVLNEDESKQFDQGHMVIRDSDVNGSNFCATFHPKSFVLKLFGELFDLVDHFPGGSKGTPPQDLYIFRKK